MSNTSNYSLSHKAIRTRVRSQLELGGDGGDALTVQYPNQKIPTPNETPWLDLSISPVGKDRADLGGGPKGRYRYFGIAIVAVRVPAARGDDVALQLADRVEAVLRSVTLTESGTNVTFRTPRLGSTPFISGPWWQVNVICPFWSDSQVT